MNFNKLHFVLGPNGSPVLEKDYHKWLLWMESNNLAVFRDQVNKIEIVTSFLGLDHQHTTACPVLWETITFGEENQKRERCGGNTEQAEAMHNKIVELVRKEIYGS